MKLKFTPGNQVFKPKKKPESNDPAAGPGEDEPVSGGGIGKPGRPKRSPYAGRIQTAHSDRVYRVPQNQPSSLTRKPAAVSERAKAAIPRRSEKTHNPRSGHSISGKELDATLDGLLGEFVAEFVREFYPEYFSSGRLVNLVKPTRF